MCWKIYLSGRDIDVNSCCSAEATAFSFTKLLVLPLDNEYFAMCNAKTGIPCSELRKCQIKTQPLC